MKGRARQRRAERLRLAVCLSDLAIGALLALGGRVGSGAIFYALGTVLLAGRLFGWPAPSDSRSLRLMALALWLNAAMLGKSVQWLLAGGGT
ncbi:hypothetical protein DAETH_46610 (plasmid) [Deinococcus aetherius]|uniref:Uncharacterized protein n=1 Tax=Deinococcus aetherius TaxID=200252 RepID=A0ABN6RSA4_9DEIO|nr:hypothetical protein [Deinococcus aetherius]BDP44692.1 hypothetical protein DAETH_46610 [Deinococcus aetherius]